MVDELDKVDHNIDPLGQQVPNTSIDVHGYEYISEMAHTTRPQRIVAKSACVVVLVTPAQKAAIFG